MKKIICFFLILILLIIGILLYSRYIGTTGLNIKEYKIKYTKLSDDFYGLKIVHLSDIYYGNTINKKNLKNVVKKINLLKPDIVILSGDITTKGNENEIIDLLSKIDASIGKYAISGDNDKNDNIILNSGFKNLNNTYELIYTKKTDYILLAGMSSNISDKTKIEEKLKDVYSFFNENKPNYSILVMHEPDYIDKVDYSKFNLILAGHSLGGQIRLPGIGGIIKQKGSNKYTDTYYKLDTAKMYISSGLGTNKYSFRFNNRPSFNLYRLTNK